MYQWINGDFRRVGPDEHRAALKHERRAMTDLAGKWYVEERRGMVWRRVAEGVDVVTARALTHPDAWAKDPQ